MPCNSQMVKTQFYCLSALQRAKTISLLPYNTMKVYSTLMGGQTQEMYSFEEMDEDRVNNMWREVLSEEGTHEQSIKNGMMAVTLHMLKMLSRVGNGKF